MIGFLLDLVNLEREIKILLDMCLVSRWRTRWTNADEGTSTSGHAFLHKRCLSDSPECGCGRGPETVEYIIKMCSYYDDIRGLDSKRICLMLVL